MLLPGKCLHRAYTCLANGNTATRCLLRKRKEELAFIIVTHGDIGESLLAVAEYILGRKLDNFAAVKVPFMGELQHVIDSNGQFPFAERRQLIREEISKARNQVDQGGGIIVLTDLFGGTGFSVAREFFTSPGGVIIAGVNLPMLLKAAEIRQGSPAEVAADLVDRSRKAIVCRFLPRP